MFASSGLTADEFLARVEISVGAEYLEDGTVVNRSGVRWAEGEVESSEAPEEPSEPETPWIDPELDRQLALPSDKRPDTMDVWFRLRASQWDRGDDPVFARWKGLLRGEIASVADDREVRARALAARNAAGEAALDALVDDLSSVGAEIVETAPSSGQVRALLAPTDVESFLGDERVAAVYLQAEEREDSYGYWQTITTTGMTGYNYEDVLQTYQFYAADLLGDTTAYHGNGVIGQVESGADMIFRDHVGFNDNTGSPRVENCERTCFITCWCSDADPTTGGDHATAVASALVGDLTRGQDSSITGTNARRERSGVARRARLFGVSPSEGLSWVDAKLSDPDNGIYITNSSFSTTESDGDCLGRTTWSAGYNALYEDGLAMFKSASNDYHEDADDCRVGPPGSAIGVFAVAAYHGLGETETIDASSSRGGTATEGDSRTIINLASASSFYFAYPHYDRPTATETVGAPYNVTSGNTYYYGADWGGPDSTAKPQTLSKTSGATPTAAGSADVFAQWFRAVWGNLVDDPGILYANMLLMGDRTLEGGSRSDNVFDGLWGAGKLRLRRFDSIGMDGPAGWNSGTRCVPAGQNVNIDISSSITSDVDIIKAVVWWYDRRHQDGITGGDGIAHDELGTYLQYYYGSGLWLTVETDASDDNKQRVFTDAAGSHAQWRLQVNGQDVTADDEGCETNSMRIYFAWFYEDSDRESAENLQTVRPE